MLVFDKIAAADPTIFPASRGEATDLETLLGWVMADVPPRSSPPTPPAAIAALPTAAPAKSRVASTARHDHAGISDDAPELDYRTRDWTAAEGALGDGIYEPYALQSLEIPDAKPHPTALVQSAAMASVAPPKPSYRPHLPARLIADGVLSDAQIESIIYAGEAHAGHITGSWSVDETWDVVTAPSSASIIQAGTVIPAALITGIRSDIPGQISAQVTQNVYDSPTGRVLLIPQGARLIGEYDSDTAAGQRRVLLAWDRLILPGGRSIGLDRQAGADASGYAGLEDGVSNHWGRMLRAALVSSLLGVGTELAAGGEGDLVRALRSGLQDSTNEAGRRVVERELSVPPTLTVRPGYSFRVIVTRDLVLEDRAEGGER